MQKGNCFGESLARAIRVSLPMWLLALLVGTLIGYFAVSPRLSMPVLVLMAGTVGLLLWLSRDVRISALRIEKLCCYVAFVTGFFGVALLAIDLGPFTLFPFRVALLLLWALFLFRALAAGGRLALPLRQVRLYVLFLGLWVGYALSSLGWAASTVDAVRDIVFLVMGVSVVFFVVYYFSTEQDQQKLFWLWGGVLGVLILLGLWEHMTGQHLPVSGYYGEARARFMFRPTGVFHNPNDYATFLALSIPFALAMLRYARTRLARLIGLGSAFAAFYLIVVTGSRANMLAVLLELAFLVLLTNLKQKLKVGVTVAICLAAALFLFPGPLHRFVSEVTGGLSSIATQAKLGTGSVAVRMNLVRNGLDFLYSTAGFGVGAGNAEYWMANFARYDTAGILNPHNWWLEILINYGLFVFAGYLVFYSSLVRQLWRTWRTTGRSGTRMIAEALLVALVGFLITSISSSSIMAFTPQWLLFAFALAFLNWWRRSRAREVP